MRAGNHLFKLHCVFPGVVVVGFTVCAWFMLLHDTCKTVVQTYMQHKRHDHWLQMGCFKASCCSGKSNKDVTLS